MTATFVILLYATSRYILKAEEIILDISTRYAGNITCGDNAVIRIDNATVYANESHCAASTECVLNDDDFKSIEASCNENQYCTIDFPMNTSCLKQDRYLNFSYGCLAPINLLCTFEFSFCSWVPISDHGTSWRRYSPKSNKSLLYLPRMDHTTKSQNGSYIYWTTQTKDRNAILKSQNISFETGKCLQLWYEMDSTSILIITIYSTSDDPTKIQITNDEDNSWKMVHTSLDRGESSQIVIEGILGRINNAYIAVDDIDIQDWYCSASEPVSCNFEEDFCNFKIQPLFGLRWERSRSGNDLFGKPLVDHTNEEGFYIYTQSIYHQASTRRTIIITFDTELKVRCLSLWYYKYGREPGNLNIYAVVKNLNDTTSTYREEFLSAIIDTQKNMWRQFQVNVVNTIQIIMEYNFTVNSFGGIALDDIYISPIICADEVQFTDECVEKNVELKMQCPVSNVRNIVMAFDPNITMSCQTSTDQVENKLEEVFKQCENASMCVFTPAELLDSECYSISKRLQLMFSCTAETSTVITTPIHDSAETSTVISTQIHNSAETSTVISTQIHNSASNPMYTIIIVSVLIIVLVAFGVITVVCYRRKTAKLPQHIGNRQDETANDMTDSTDYTAINYNEMKDIDIPKINENKKGKMTTHRNFQGHKAFVEKEENNCNKYESLAAIRNSEEHVYESGCAHDNQYQSLTNQRELDEHSYESTEHALAQYQSLTNRSESDNHTYESTSIHTDVLQNKK